MSSDPDTTQHDPVRPARPRRTLWVLLAAVIAIALLLPRFEPVRLWLLNRKSTEELGNAARSDGKDVLALTAYARRLRDTGQETASAPYFVRAVEALGPEESGARAKELVPEAAYMVARFGSELEAEGLVERATKLSPDDAHTLLASGILATRKQDLAAAQPFFEKATKREPENGDAWNRLGTCLLGQGKVTAAEAALRKAVQLQPKKAGSHGDLGEALMQQMRFKDAREAFRAAAELAPDSTDYLAQYGISSANAARTDEDYEAASTLLVTAMQASPDDVAVPLNLAGLQMRFAHMEEARRTFETVVALAPDHPDAWFNLSNVYNRLGDRATSAMARAKFQELLDQQTRIVELKKKTLMEPNNASFHAALSDALHQQGNDEEAYRALQRACELAPNNAKLQARLREATEGLERARAAGRIGAQ